MVISAWALLWGALMMRVGGFSWRYFVTGGDAVIHFGASCGGWHVYACHPELQYGPLTLLVSGAVHLLPTAVAKPVALSLMLLSGPALLVMLGHRVSGTGRRRHTLAPTVLAAGGLMMPFWAVLAVYYAHLDDVLAMVALVAAVAALRRARYLPATFILAASASAKPWAVGFVTLLLLVPAARRARHVVIYVAVTAGAWLPFFLADAGTWRLTQFGITNAPSSALRALGIVDPTTPAWDRPAQLTLAVVLGLVLGRRGRWAWVPLAVLASRLLLDPQVYGYYSAGLLMAAVVADLGGAHLPSRQTVRVPWWTLTCATWAVADQIAMSLISESWRGHLRLMFLCTLILALVLGSGRSNIGKHVRVQDPLWATASASATLKSEADATLERRPPVCASRVPRLGF